VLVMAFTVGPDFRSYTELLQSSLSSTLIDRRKIMSARKFVVMVAVLVASAVLVMAQGQTPVVKYVPIKPTNAASGQDMFKNYCAVCHGESGKGDGPAASAMKVSPVDLTTLAQKNGGKYPALHISSVVRGEADIRLMAPRTCRYGDRCFSA
jgi:mono/diheme cytochrome c family protein